MGTIMSDEQSFSEGSSFAPKNVKKSHFVGVFFLILFVVIILLVGLYFFGASKHTFLSTTNKPQPTTKPTLASKPSITPTFTPVPTQVKRSSLQVAVLNGSGVAGAAQGISTQLTGLGYTVKTVGNADRFDYTGITVKVKKTQSIYLELLKKDLADKTTVVTATIDDTITTDAVVIVGK